MCPTLKYNILKLGTCLVFYMPEITNIRLDEIVADVNQPRQEFNPTHLATLVKSIKSKGILNPLVIEKQDDGKYLLIDGERRYRSAVQLNLKEVPAIVKEPMNELDRLILRFELQENSKPWSALEKAKALKTVVDIGQYTPSDIADMLNLSINQVRHYRLMLLTSKETQQAIVDRSLSVIFAADLGQLSIELKASNLEKYKDKLEKSLVEKIERGLITNRKQLRAIKLSVTKGGKDIIENIIKIKDYSDKQALIDSKAGSIYLLNSMITHGHWFEGNLNKAIENSLFEIVDHTQHNTLLRLQKKLNKFLSLIKSK